MLVPPAAGIEPSVRGQQTQRTLLVVDQERDRDHIERAFDDEPVIIETAATLAVARSSVDEIDCLLVPSTVTDNSGMTSDDVAATDRSGEHVGWLETVKTDTPALPVVVLADEVTPPLMRAVRTYEWTAVVGRDEPRERLVTCITDLLERHRLTSLSKRSLASVELTGDAVALVDPTGRIQFASRSLRMQFGADDDELVGTPWQELFTDDAVSHLESVALPTVGEGWRWTGTCTGQRRTGVTFPVRVRLGGLEDGSLVFVVTEADASASGHDD
ncbi:PAS domain S-box-containing protein [Natrinema hispanicum]|uniref:PAS domain S-box-containing protein n=1 Tax=Natrinema hispanicum TaxID=392421 RepID=A0A482YFR0_9EURY|nr:PAS domain-containing protein [Natrinema hispanicum]RZV11910.1 PAS domain S-box-containing protein [Natrinema hispanicum]